MRRLIVLTALVLTMTATVLAGSSPLPVETHVVVTGPAPCGTAVARGALWVGVYETGKLLRIDLRTKRMTRRFAVGPLGVPGSRRRLGGLGDA